MILFIIITQFGFCIVYNIFVATNMSEAVKTLWGVHLTMTVWLLITFVIMVPYNFIRNWETLAFFSTFANFLQISGLIFILWDLVHGLPSIGDRETFAPAERWPLYFGTVIYAFEGIA